MNCPTCGKALRAIQIETMIGNPDFTDWSRNGYCSLDCFNRRNPQDQTIDVPPRIPTNERPELPTKPIPASKAREFDAYTLATACLLTTPFIFFLGIIGNISGAYQYPQAALGFFLLYCAILTSGLCAGIIALFAIRKRGPKGLLWRSLIGMTMIIGFCALAIFGFLKARELNPGVPRDQNPEDSGAPPLHTD
ncbi:MAG: hypothetical protein O3A87_08660 [Verrucomicrobia bacterium]|nr:hypothetical protein [Verrucomicrobiota bacterium]MDA1006534.1 hypothetical protein [Verrucomicrobiota bacterium]